ncbi:hypothetical protein K469DRAFT_701639 [Zopfia rhizophila CBS 207.26]|uniref:tRNA (guanine(9)-N1)-methyltransferase n=1 Tax=Zopfia rhizophila CBS 207.26 TaxID=1314779 RepID=A0A6A6D7Z2_9PEZI|nr:hypothetical protein K469DRAFT_701639 [Zopfia rhizophila CBS 207.26]
MESEERPTKMRKVDHVLVASGAQFADSTPISGSSEAVKTSPTHDQGVTNTDKEKPDENKGPFEPDRAAPRMSKNQLKKLRRLEQWEAGREDRRSKRREKTKAKKERRREVYAQDQALENGDAGDGAGKSRKQAMPHKTSGSQVPITFIFDCDFDDFMFEQELKSLGLQITRCYADNRKAPFQAHLVVASFGGKLKERFDGILAKQYTSWKGFRFFPDDFVTVSEKAKEWMKGNKGGTIAGALHQENESINMDGAEGEVIYLSSESDVTLERLRPNSTYIIGGLVDKNRHKGLCYKRAMDRAIKTAKLPIGDFLQMKSRQVLTTNHVCEIMLKWLELGDWGEAFMQVIPKRKGGTLKGEAGNQADDDGESASGAGDGQNACDEKGEDDREQKDAAHDSQELIAGEPASGHIEKAASGPGTNSTDR